MKISKATQDDVPALCELIKQYRFAPDGSGFLLPVSEAWVNDAVAQGRFFAAHEGTLVGCAALIEYGGIAEIRSLAVAPPYRGNGLGTELITACTREAKARGYHDLFALTQNTRPFEKAGFVPSATPDQKQDAYCTACPLYSNGCKEVALRYTVPQSNGGKGI